MLGQSHYYNRTIRKIVVAFGTIFNDLHIVRYDANNNAKETFKVPLSFGSKEKYLTRITSDPTLTKSIATVVPRISFDLTGMSYDSSRKQQSLLQNFGQRTDGTITNQYAPVPYDFNFSVSIYVRNTEDGTQIIEQILPFFKPDFTVTVDFVSDIPKKYDMPIILNSVNTTTDYEGDMMTTRLIIWDLDFTVKGFLWPAVKTDKGLIGQYSNTYSAYGKAYTNIYIDTQDRDAQKVYVNYATGNNVFATGETIRVTDRDITGKVVYFSNTSSGVLIVGELNKLLKANDVVVGDYTNAHYTVSSVDVSPLKAVTITTEPVPQNSSPDDEFGFAETITDWPNNI
jgi:hypothetical protein